VNAQRYRIPQNREITGSRILGPPALQIHINVSLLSSEHFKTAVLQPKLYTHCLRYRVLYKARQLILLPVSMSEDTCIHLRHITLKKTYIHNTHMHTYILFHTQVSAVDMHNVSGELLGTKDDRHSPEQTLPRSTENSTVSNCTYTT
jgi:hypothetical protein